MGDKCEVQITVRAHQAEAAAEALGDMYHDRDDFDEFTAFTFQEVNYANVDDELTRLADVGIACDVDWTSGGEYDAGNAYQRFDANGDVLYREVGDGEDAIECTNLIRLIDDIPALTALIRTRYEETRPLSWENQDEYGKRHRAKLLISPT